MPDHHADSTGMSLQRNAFIFIALLTLAGCAAESCADRHCTPDEELTQRVYATLRKDPALAADNLRVYCTDGVVYVHGMVSTYPEYASVDKVVGHVWGVKRVLNMTGIDNVRS